MKSTNIRWPGTRLEYNDKCDLMVQLDKPVRLAHALIDNTFLCLPSNFSFNELKIVNTVERIHKHNCMTSHHHELYISLGAINN